MLAYRHAFHAGNHADVLKHLTLVQCLQHLNLKEKGWRCVDTHAGAGRYALRGPVAMKTAEHREGIARVVDAARQDGDAVPAAVADYLRAVRAAVETPDGALRQYPGSPALAAQLARPQDQLHWMELHPSDHRLLEEGLGGLPGRVVRRADGFEGWRAAWPPPTRRGLMVIDPSYELEADYARTAATVRDALQRFAAGIVLVWLPQVARLPATQLPRKLLALADAAGRGWVHARLTVGTADPQGFGLFGSSVVVINPPHTLHAALAEALPWLATVLDQGASAAPLLEQRAV